MALNKFMHPRNIYRNPPDFEKLSKLYQEFSNIAKMDVTGKVTIDFKDPNSLRVLTKCLLKFDFNLDVEIPEDRLVPTLPLRLNYILWIEDLLAAVQKTSGIQGIDIGTGACAVYPLLAAVKNKWHMVATEVDSVSLLKAKENITRNNLQGLISLINNDGPKLIESLFTEQNKQKFDFCMCNPPFYSNLQELLESRSPARLPPKNGFTGSPQELITEGGELQFCRKLIDESRRCKNHVLIFTTMVGHKYNLYELLQDLKAAGVKHTHTEFCQGRVTRWGLAWTYQDYNIYHLVPPRDKLRKKHAPIALQLPQIPDCEYNVETAYNKIKAMLCGLHIEQQILHMHKSRITFDILAKENTWSNQRRKRRLMKRMETTDPKKFKLGVDEPTHDKTNQTNVEIKDGNIQSDIDGSISNETIKVNLDTISDKMLKSNGDGSVMNENIKSDPETAGGNMLKSEINGSIDIETCSVPETFNSCRASSSNGNINETYPGITETITLKLPEDDPANKTESKTTHTNMLKSDGNRLTSDETSKTIRSNFSVSDDKINQSISSKDSIKLQQQTKGNKKDEALVHAFMKLYKKDETINLEIEFINGTGGKESVHQVIQYIKNNWK